MARDLNKVMIIGRLGRDPEMRYTPGGSPVTRICQCEPVRLIWRSSGISAIGASPARGQITSRTISA